MKKPERSEPKRTSQGHQNELKAKVNRAWRTAVQLRAVAYHEAGHAVMVVREHVQLRRVSIEPGDEYDGRTEHGRLLARVDEIGVTPTMKEALMRHARICLAGWIAQRKGVAGSTRRWHWAEDRRSAIDAVDVALDGVGPGKVLDAYLRAVRFETESTLTGPWWQSVEALAAALLGRPTLPGKEAERIIRKALLRT